MFYVDHLADFVNKQNQPLERVMQNLYLKSVLQRCSSSKMPANEAQFKA